MHTIVLVSIHSFIHLFIIHKSIYLSTYLSIHPSIHPFIYSLSLLINWITKQVWPGVTVYPDFTNPESQDYWEQEIVKFHDIVGFDGLWIDMNEPSNFQDGSIYGCPNSSLNTPPYLPGVTLLSSFLTLFLCSPLVIFLHLHHFILIPAAIRQSWNPNKILEKTLCMTAKQNLSLHYNVHSLYGHTEAIATMT